MQLYKGKEKQFCQTNGNVRRPLITVEFFASIDIASLNVYGSYGPVFNLYYPFPVTLLESRGGL